MTALVYFFPYLVRIQLGFIHRSRVFYHFYKLCTKTLAIKSLGKREAQGLHKIHFESLQFFGTSTRQDLLIIDGPSELRSKPKHFLNQKSKCKEFGTLKCLGLLQCRCVLSNSANATRFLEAAPWVGHDSHLVP